MLLGLHPGIIFGLAVVLFLLTHIAFKWPLPVAFVGVGVATALLGDWGVPFRHLVEGGFGFINLVLALFAGAFFGHMVNRSGCAEDTAGGVVNLVGGRVLPALALIGAPIFVVGMFVGIAGPAVLSAGVYAVPALRRLGFADATIAAFIAVIATAGMIAPPTNVPAMFIADGVNMPWSNTARALLALAIPTVIVALLWFTWGEGPSRASVRQAEDDGRGIGALIRGLLPIIVMVVIWLAVRAWPLTVVDPATPLILVIGGLAALPMLKSSELGNVMKATFTGTPLVLGAVLVTVGVLVQIMTLTGVRGWLVITTMSLVSPWNYPSMVIGMPLIGGALTSMTVADVIGVPAAFSFIGQNMILNVAAISGISALAEFVPPTSIASALACYVVGTPTVGQVFRRSWLPMLVLAILSVLMLLFAPQLSGLLT